MDSLAQDLQLINDLVDVPQSSGKAESPPSNDLDASIESLVLPPQYEVASVHSQFQLRRGQLGLFFGIK